MVKIGIIGLGRIGRVHLEGISTGVAGARVVAAAEPNLTPETEAFARSFGEIRLTRDYTDVLADREVDAVLVCSSTDTHADISVEAIGAGKHVFCEKPVDKSPAEILRVRDALRETGAVFQVGFNRRFDHNFAALKTAVLSGKVGAPQLVRITSRDPEPPSPAYAAVSGGIFLDMSIHDFDMARFLSGGEVEEVYAVGEALIDPEIGKAGDYDTALTVLKMDNGAICSIDNSRKAVYGYDQRAEVFGGGGMVSCSNDTPSSAVYSGPGGVTGERPLHFFLERYMESFREEIRSFVRSVERGTPPAVGLEDGLRATQIALAATRSAREHRPVKLAEIAE